MVQVAPVPETVMSPLSPSLRPMPPPNSMKFTGSVPSARVTVELLRKIFPALAVPSETGTSAPASFTPVSASYALLQAAADTM